jgi:hypothetical protein
VFEFAEEAFDQIALSVDRFGHGALNLSPPLGRDVGCRTDGLDAFDQGAGVISAICDNMADPGQAGD